MKRFKQLISFSMVVLFLFSCKNDSKSIGEKPDNTETTENIKDNTQSKSEINGKYVLENDLSEINWTGSKPAGKHNGKIKIKSGEVTFQNDKLVSGKFTIDMNSISVLDLEGEEKNDLEKHLKGDIEDRENHFFNVDKYPDAVFIIKSAEKKDDAYNIYGNLTMKGISNSVKFKANIDFSKDFNNLKLTTENFEIDRTRWGIEYMSKSVFDDLKERFIYDEIGLKVMFKASRI